MQTTDRQRLVAHIAQATDQINLTALITLDETPDLGDAEKLMRGLITEHLYDKHPQVKAAYDAWSESINDERTGTQVIVDALAGSESRLPHTELRHLVLALAARGGVEMSYDKPVPVIPRNQSWTGQSGPLNQYAAHFVALWQTAYIIIPGGMTNGFVRGIVEVTDEGAALLARWTAEHGDPLARCTEQIEDGGVTRYCGLRGRHDKCQSPSGFRWKAGAQLPAVVFRGEPALKTVPAEPGELPYEVANQDISYQCAMRHDGQPTNGYMGWVEHEHADTYGRDLIDLKWVPFCEIQLPGDTEPTRICEDCIGWLAGLAPHLLEG